MKTKRLLLVSGLGLGAVLTFCCLFRLIDNIGDAAVALCCPPVYQKMNATAIENIVVSANLAKQCLENDYTPEMVLALAPLYKDFNPKRANELLNLALSHTATGISNRSAFDIMLQLAALRLAEKRYSEAENYVTSAMRLRCSNDLQGSSDDRVTCLWLFCNIEKAQEHYDKAEKFLEEATELSYGYLPESPCMQGNLALLLEERAELKTLTKHTDQAAELRKRATLTRQAMSRDTVSPLEMPFILAARVKYERDCKAAGIDPAEEKQTPSAAPLVASKELLAQLRHLRFPIFCHRTDKELQDLGSVTKSADDVYIDKVVDCSPFGPIAGPGEINNSDGSSTSDNGELFRFCMQTNTATIAKGSTRESIHCEPPQVWWDCSGMNIDKKNNRLIAVSNEGMDTTFFEKPIHGSQNWTALASLSSQGVQNAGGLFFGPENDFYTFERDMDKRITAIVRLTHDGTVLSKAKLRAPLGIDTDRNMNIARCKDKIVLIQPDGGAISDENGTYSSGSSWVLDFKGNILACIPFDQPVEVSSANIDQ